MEASIQVCKHCGSNEGYFTKDYAFGPVWPRFNFDGSEADNAQMYDSLSYKMGKNAYCISCGKKLFNLSEIQGG